MDPLALAGVLATLIVVPLVLIALFAVIGKVFSAPRRFGTIVFLILFAGALAAAAYGYLRAGEVSAATVTSISERIVVDDALRARHEFEIVVQIPDLGAKTVAVPPRIFDDTDVGDQIDVRAGSVLGLKLARADGERIDDLIPLGSLVCAVLVVLLTAIAATARRARAAAILLMLGALAGIGIQPAIQALPQAGSTQLISASVTGVTSVGAAGAPSRRITGYLRGPFSIDHRWMWANNAKLRFVAVTFTPRGGSRPVTAADVVPAGAVPTIGDPAEVRYRTADNRHITLGDSQSAACGWILLGLLAAVEVLLVLVGLLIWRARARRRRRREVQIDLDRNVSRDIERSTRRPGARPGDETDPQFARGGYAAESPAEETRPLTPVRSDQPTPGYQPAPTARPGPPPPPDRPTSAPF